MGLVGERFGTDVLGGVLGLVYVSHQLFAGLGVLVGGLLRAWTGSFDAALVVGAAVLCTGVALLLGSTTSTSRPGPLGPDPRRRDSMTLHRTDHRRRPRHLLPRGRRPGRPHVLLLHGLPTSSRMFRNLIPALADRYHLIAPDYPGFGYSSFPPPDEFDYTFAKLAEVVEGFTESSASALRLYVQDYGAPDRLRIAIQHPERIAASSSRPDATWRASRRATAPLQAYWKDAHAEHREAGRDMITAGRHQMAVDAGEPHAEKVGPDAWTRDQRGLDRPGNATVQLELFYEYRDNVANYPSGSSSCRSTSRPCSSPGARTIRCSQSPACENFKDLPDAEVHVLDAGHFALEADGPEIAAAMLDFLGRHVAAARPTRVARERIEPATHARPRRRGVQVHRRRRRSPPSVPAANPARGRGSLLRRSHRLTAPARAHDTGASLELKSSRSASRVRCTV